MAKIIDLAQAKLERSPHIAGEAFCPLCQHTWTGIWPAGTVNLECPSCHSLRGRSRYDISPAEGQQIWTCKCGEQFFNILADRVHCPGCGQQWDLSEF